MELEEFYNMNNRDVFQKYGVYAYEDYDKILLANSLVIDSLLKDKYDEVDSMLCGCTEGNHYQVTIIMQDGTKIVAGDSEQFRGVTIQKGDKKARVEYDTLSKASNQEVINNIDNLSVENVFYTGDEELIKKLQIAIEEQFITKVKEEEIIIPSESDEVNKKNIDDDINVNIDLLEKQIVAKKLQMVIESSEKDIRNDQIIDVEEFESLSEILCCTKGLQMDYNYGYVASELTDECPGYYTYVPVEQYIHIGLPNGKRIIIELSGRKNEGKISLKEFEKMSYPNNIGDCIDLKNNIKEQELIEGLQIYRTNLSLKELLEKKLTLKDSELSKLEIESKKYDEMENLLHQLEKKENNAIGEN